MKTPRKPKIKSRANSTPPEPLPTVNPRECPLAWLRARGQISLEEYAAGDRLRRDFELGQMAARLTMRWEARIAPTQRGRMARPATDPGSGALDARRRLSKALEAVGPELSGMLLEVCCLAGGLELAERRLALPQRAGKVVLQLGLTRLARHYGLIPPPPPQSHIRSWGLDDVRPDIESSRGPAPSRLPRGCA